MSSEPTRVLAVCLGNICRSPMAEAVLRRRAAEAGVAIEIDSAGTSRAHAGEPADPRTRWVLAAAGYQLDHTSRQLRGAWLGERDLVLVMDSSNLRDVRALAEREGIGHDHVMLLRSFDGQAAADDQDVPDPWYGGDDGFVDVLRMVEQACEGVIAHLAASRSAAR